ncbi:MAG: hypothetical protein EBR52_09505 [Microbacteriaceae bacterium]|nr:hypothetical protein [Microbacteriaceae bacterium]
MPPLQPRQLPPRHYTHRLIRELTVREIVASYITKAAEEFAASAWAVYPKGQVNVRTYTSGSTYDGIGFSKITGDEEWNRRARAAVKEYESRIDYQPPFE